MEKAKSKLDLTVTKLPDGPKPKEYCGVKSKNFLKNGPLCVDDWINPRFKKKL